MGVVVRLGRALVAALALAALAAACVILAGIVWVLWPGE